MGAFDLSRRQIAICRTAASRPLTAAHAVFVDDVLDTATKHYNLWLWEKKYETLRKKMNITHRLLHLRKSLSFAHKLVALGVRVFCNGLFPESCSVPIAETGTMISQLGEYLYS